MKLPTIIFKEKEPFVLEHEILRIFYNVTWSGRSTGSEAKGYVPIYKRFYGTGIISYSVLVDILNNPDKYIKKDSEIKAKGGVINYYQNPITQEEITTDKYSYWQVSNAIEVLEANGHLKEPDINPYDIRIRTITLTERGMLAYIAEYYLKKYRKESFQESLAKSTINTNRLMIFFTFVIAVSAALNLICNKPKDYAKELQPTQQHLESMLKSQENQLYNVQKEIQTIQAQIKAILDSLPNR